MPDSSVKAACCSYAAGLSQCVSQCVKINDAIEQGMFTTTCTVRSCVWNVSAKEIEPTQVRKMSIAEYKQLKESKHFDSPCGFSKNSSCKQTVKPCFFFDS